ncbi:ABC transporter permease subunit [Bradyrhizobium liaoningense]
MDYAIVLLVEILGGIGGLFLISLGLAVIFGMMRVINIAHGEFVAVGAYAMILSAKAGANIWLAILLIAPLSGAILGVIVERCLIRFLYGRLFDSLLATWGLSLLLIGTITTLLGNTVEGMPSPLGSVLIGSYRMSLYTLFVIAVAVALLAIMYAALRFTSLGLIARGTMQNPEVAASLGVAPNRVYMVTFALGAGLAGLAGGVFAPMMAVVPTMGTAFVAKAFITVISGGAAMVAGSAASSVLFGSIGQVTTVLAGPVWGDAAMLLAAIILLRALPEGITGRFWRSAQ